ESNGHDVFDIGSSAAMFRMMEKTTLRVESALDGALFRVVEGSIAIFEGKPPKLSKVGPGEAVQSIGGVQTRVKDAVDSEEQKAWDQWVSAESRDRKADIEKGLQLSGLKAPIPGLVDLVRGGTFEDCPPYGKCWEPNEATGVAGEAGDVDQLGAAQEQGPGGAGAANSQ